jgi:hypothetical protein
MSSISLREYVKMTTDNASMNEGGDEQDEEESNSTITPNSNNLVTSVTSSLTNNDTGSTSPSNTSTNNNNSNNTAPIATSTSPQLLRRNTSMGPPGAYAVAPGNVITQLATSKASLLSSSLSSNNANSQLLSSGNRHSIASENIFLSTAEIISMLVNSRTYDDHEIVSTTFMNNQPLNDNDIGSDDVTIPIDNTDQSNSNHNISVPVAHLVPIQEEDDNDSPVPRTPPMTVVGTPYVENEYNDPNSNPNNPNGNDDDDNNLQKSIRLKKIICILTTMVVIMFCVAGIVGTVCGITNSCSKKKSTNNSNDENDIFENKTVYPLNERAIAMKDYINNITLSNQTVTYPININGTNTTPEELALHWMIAIDPLQLLVNKTEHLYQIRQRYALQTLFFATSKGKNEWMNVSGWLNNNNNNNIDNECGWFGVYCTNITTMDDSIISMTTIKINAMVVTKLDLNHNGLRGYILPDIGLLSHLQEIDLSSNLVDGPLPESIGQWTSIRHINLQRWDATNVSPLKLYGAIPNSVGNWNKLISINLNGHNFTGTLPPSMSNWNASIESLIISNNAFTGTFPSFITLYRNLTILELGINQFNGTIPNDIGNLHLLQSLYLYYNNISGTLPTSIQYLTNIESFDVGRNVLTGTIPSGVAYWSNIENVNFMINNFVGSVPETLCSHNNLSSLVIDCESTLLQNNCSCCVECR